MRADALKSNVYPVRTEMTALSLHFRSTDGDKSNGITAHKTLLQSCSTDRDKSKGIIVNEDLSQSCSNDEDELCYTEEDKSGYPI